MLDRLFLLCDSLHRLIWGAPLLVLLFGTGVYFSIKTGFFQFTHAGFWLRHTLFACFSPQAHQTKSETTVSPFATMCTALAATVGTGNIAGVATALTLGGAGAVFWMWISAAFGMMTAFAENVLGMLYREKASDGSWRGGAMFYLKNGLGSPLLAGIFALCCVLASLGMGNMSQCSSIAEGLAGAFGVPPLATGCATLFLLGGALRGGLRRITQITQTLVPVMALFYMGGACIVLWHNRAALPQALHDILSGAFDLRAGASGVCGYGMAQAIRIGVSRGIFSNEAGMGSSVLAHIAADSNDPCGQGMWAIFEVFFDTIVMCTVTALVILSSGVFTPLAPTGARLTALAFSTVFGKTGSALIALSLVLFAFSTLLGWSYYGQRAAAYLFGDGIVPLYRLLFLAVVLPGCILPLEPVWALSDLFNGLMAFPNLVGILALRHEILRTWQHRKEHHF